ncbi:hypothetical protein [Sporosarcina sp. FSL W7-1283]|uniref:hypothetical protein n=1 Tax=Sporosarcina sp. FSL W7-1283 TaxID=2921560 RepID=UPI0030F70457
MQYEMKRNHPSITRIERLISEVETANRYVKKTTRLHQNNKKLSRLNKELQRAIYQYNKFDLFNFLEEEMNKRITELHASGRTIAFSELYE